MAGRLGWPHYSARRGFRALVSPGSKLPSTLKHFDFLTDLPRQDPHANVTVKVSHSDLNYKDAMIALSQKGVVKQFPIVPGIDFAGKVQTSTSPLFKEGDDVVLTGNKAGQFFDGGYSELAACQAEWLAPIPKGLDAHSAMVIGTAGFTAMMCVAHLESAGGLRPEHGPVLVTGGAGGLGQVATSLLAAKGYEVIVSSGRSDLLKDKLLSLGASSVIGRLPPPSKPLTSQQWVGVVDAVGGATLASAMSSTAYGGCIASTGVAGGGELNTTVYPLILRGIRLLGVDSTLPWNIEGYPTDKARWLKYRQERLDIWEQLSELLPNSTIAKLHSDDIGLDQVVEYSQAILRGEVAGRVVVRTNTC